MLAVSMDQRVQQVLNTDERGCYEASLLNVHNNVTSPQCILTGQFWIRRILPCLILVPSVCSKIIMNEIIIIRFALTVSKFCSLLCSIN